MAAQLLGRVGAMAANLASMVLIARALPQSQFGIYVLVTGLVNVLAQVADFGTGPVFGQHVGSLDVARGPVRLPGSAWGSFLLIRAALGCLATLMGFALALTFSGAARWAMILVSLSVACAAGRFLDPLYQVAGQAWRSTATQLAGACAVIGFALIAWAVRPTLGTFLCGFVAANAVYAGAAWLAARDLVVGPMRVEIASVRRMAALAAPMGAAGLLTAVNGRANLLFLARDGGPPALATYGAATRVLDLAVNLAVVVLWPLIPILTKSAHEGAAPLALQVRRLTRLLLRLVLPVLVAAPAASPFVVRMLYGARYADAAPVLAALAVVGRRRGVQLLASYTLLALRVTGYAIGITGISVVVNLTLNAILVPRYGPMGAAAAGIGCEAVLMGLVYVALARHVPGALASEMLPFMAASLLAWFGTNVVVRAPWLGVLVVTAWAAAGYVREQARPERFA